MGFLTRETSRYFLVINNSTISRGFPSDGCQAWALLELRHSHRLVPCGQRTEISRVVSIILKLLKSCDKEDGDRCGCAGREACKDGEAAD